MHVRELLDPRARQRQQVVVHPLIVLADDVQAGIRQQVVDVGDAAGDRVLDRDHRQPGVAVADGRERVLERPAGQRRQLRPGRAAGQIGVGAERALKRDDAIRVGRGRRVRRAAVIGPAPPAWRGLGPDPLACRPRAAPYRRRRRRCACRSPAHAAAPGARAARARPAGVRRIAQRPPGDRRRGRYGATAAPRPTVPVRD